MNDFILQTEGLSRSFGGFQAVDGLDLNVRRGQIHALIGPNGAGKTTAFNMLTRFLEPSAGRIVLDGQDITRTEPAHVASRGMVRSFQISSTFGRLTALQNVRVALMSRGGETYGFWRSHREMDKYNDRSRALLQSVGLEKWSDTQASLLPYGRKRALELATTLALEPKVMLLDEPLAGMGQEDIDQIKQLIMSLAGARTILIVEHNVKVVSEIAQTISVLVRGRKIAEGSYSQIYDNPEVKLAYLGSTHV